MGNQPNKPQHKSLQSNEKQVLNEAGKIAQELHLYQTQNQMREHRHLIARILIYGHRHLITHLKTFKRDKQKDIIRGLKAIDYETTDLLYQNLILKRLKSEKNKIVYEEYDRFRSKMKEQSENQNKFRTCFGQGEQAMMDKKVAILVFAGGISSRFKNENNERLRKELYKQKQDQKCLLEIALDKINERVQMYENLLVYLVINDENHEKINQILHKYPSLPVRKILQNDSPIVNLSGKICLKKEDTFQILLSPRGCGDLANLTIRGNKLLDQLISEGINYVCITGVENIFAEVADPYLIGVLASDLLASAAFKCTYPDNQNENLKRIVRNTSQKCLQASELQVLFQKADKKCYSMIRRSPVWMNDTVFRVSHLKEYLQKRKENFNISQVYIPHKLQCTYWNPNTNSYNEEQHCYAFERELSDLLFHQDFKVIGVMVQRQQQFMPVITLREQNTWADAYNQYMYQQRNQIKTPRMINALTLNSGIIQKSEI